MCSEGLPINKKGPMLLSLYPFHVFKNYFKQSLHPSFKYLDNLKYPLFDSGITVRGTYTLVGNISLKIAQFALHHPVFLS